MTERPGRRQHQNESKSRTQARSQKRRKQEETPYKTPKFIKKVSMLKETSSVKEHKESRNKVHWSDCERRCLPTGSPHMHHQSKDVLPSASHRDPIHSFVNEAGSLAACFQSSPMRHAHSDHKLRIRLIPSRTTCLRECPVYFKAKILTSCVCGCIGFRAASMAHHSASSRMHSFAGLRPIP